MLTKYFNKYGHVDCIDKKKKNGKKAKYCYVRFQSATQCRAAYKAGEGSKDGPMRRHFIGSVSVLVTIHHRKENDKVCKSYLVFSIEFTVHKCFDL